MVGVVVKVEKMSGRETRWRLREWVSENVFEGEEEDEGSEMGGFAFMTGRPFGNLRKKKKEIMKLGYFI